MGQDRGIGNQHQRRKMGGMWRSMMMLMGLSPTLSSSRTTRGRTASSAFLGTTPVVVISTAARPGVKDVRDFTRTGLFAAHPTTWSSSSSRWRTTTTTPFSSRSNTMTTTRSMIIRPDNMGEQEWYPRDPAYTTPQLLVGIWDQIAQASTMVRGESNTVLYPQIQDQLSTPRYLYLILAHLDACKDVCDHFGITTTLVPYQQQGQVVGFTAKSFRRPDQNDQDRFEKFDYDPFWDDGTTDFDQQYQGIDELEEGGKLPVDPYPPIVNQIPEQDEDIITISRTWVDKLMSDMGICPFTAGADLAGLPLGPIHYQVDRSTSMEDMYAAFWKEVVRLEQQPERDLSTILLIAPEFCIDQLESFDSFTSTLTQPLTALGLEDLVQLVVFHPHYTFRDGSARFGSADKAAANYARRSPWPMFNLLRTSQVRKAQKGIPTGLVYKQNEKTLASVGVSSLETMLRLRDWTPLRDLKVNRRELDALKIAQDLQQTGQVRPEDLSLLHDNTPAANKVDRQQIERGNLVRVIQQALSKRLGYDQAREPSPQPLTGPETSAVAMATDFLLQEIDKRIHSSVRTTTTTAAAPPAAAAANWPPGAPSDQMAPPDGSAAGRRLEDRPNESRVESDDFDSLPTDELEAARRWRLMAARRMLMDDLTGQGGDDPSSMRTRPGEEEEGEGGGGASWDRFNGGGNPNSRVLFGKGGIRPRSPDDPDENFPQGLDPNSFY